MPWRRRTPQATARTRKHERRTARASGSSRAPRSMVHHLRPAGGRRQSALAGVFRAPFSMSSWHSRTTRVLPLATSHVRAPLHSRRHVRLPATPSATATTTPSATPRHATPSCIRRGRETRPRPPTVYRAIYRVIAVHRMQSAQHACARACSVIECVPAAASLRPRARAGIRVWVLYTMCCMYT